MLGLVYGVSVYGQWHSGMILSDGAGGAQSSILGLSAYPAQEIIGSGNLAVYGVQQVQTGLHRVGFAAGFSFHPHFIAAGGERFGNGAVQQDRFWGAYSVSIAKKSVLGLRAGVQMWSAKGYPASTGVHIGIGWASQVNDRLTWKAQVDGVESLVKKGKSGGFLIRSAVDYKVSEPAGLSVEVLLEEGQMPILIPCLQYSFAERLYGRIAVVSTLSTIGLGVGYGVSTLHIETSFIYYNKLGYSIVTGVYYKF